MKSITSLWAAVAIALSSIPFASVAQVQVQVQDKDKVAVTPATSMSAATSTGEIRKIDKEAGKMTIRHGELSNLGMPAMTMVFRASDPAMLERLKTGDKVRFVADRVDGQFVVMQVEVEQP